MLIKPNELLYNEIKQKIQEALRSALQLWKEIEHLCIILEEKILALDAELQQTKSFPEAQEALQQKQELYKYIVQKIISAQNELKTTIQALNKNELFLQKNKFNQQKYNAFFKKGSTENPLTCESLATTLTGIKGLDLTYFNKCRAKQKSLAYEHDEISHRRATTLADNLSTANNYLLGIMIIAGIIGIIFIVLCCTVLHSPLPLFISWGISGGCALISMPMSEISMHLRAAGGDHIELKPNETFLPENELNTHFSPP